MNNSFVHTVSYPYLVENGCNRGCIIRLPVTFRTIIFHADKLACGVSSILRMRAPKYFSGGIQQRRRFIGGYN
jgi:hypothetical protein